MNQITNFLCLSLLLLGATALGMDINERLIEAAERGNFEEVQRLIEFKADVNTKDRLHRQVPLHWAAAKGHQFVCELLIESKAAVNVKNKYGAAPLDGAIFARNEPLARLLIENNALVNSQTKDRWTSLTSAAANGDVDVCRLLIEKKAAIDGNEYEQPLRIAAGNRHEAACKFLIENKAAVVGNKSCYGLAPLTVAAGQGLEEICRLMLENKASADEKTAEGLTPLMNAAAGEAEGVCKLLIDVQLNKPAIATFLGIVRKRAANLPCHMHYDVAKIVARQLFQLAMRPVIEQINELDDTAKAKWLAYVNQQMNSPIKKTE